MKDKKFVSECVLESDLEILIPDEYVESSAERISLYTELNHIQNEEGLQRFAENITDRFGMIPPQTKDLLDTVRLRWLARDLGFEKILLKNGMMTAHLVTNQESAYYDTETFINVLRYAASHQNDCSVKETNGKNIFNIKNVGNVNKALIILKEISG